MSDDPKSKYKVYYYKNKSSLDATNEITLSAEGQTSKDTMTLFKNLKKEMNVEP